MEPCLSKSDCYICLLSLFRDAVSGSSKDWAPDSGDLLRIQIWAEGQWYHGVSFCLKLSVSPHVRRPWKQYSQSLMVCTRMTNSPTVPGRGQPRSWHWPDALHISPLTAACLGLLSPSDGNMVKVKVCVVVQKPNHEIKYTLYSNSHVSILNICFAGN